MQMPERQVAGYWQLANGSFFRLTPNAFLLTPKGNQPYFSSFVIRNSSFLPPPFPNHPPTPPPFPNLGK
jgi:hypothetical protein